MVPGAYQIICDSEQEVLDLESVDLEEETDQVRRIDGALILGPTLNCHHEGDGRDGKAHTLP